MSCTLFQTKCSSGVGGVIAFAMSPANIITLCPCVFIKVLISNNWPTREFLEHSRWNFSASLFSIYHRGLNLCTLRPQEFKFSVLFCFLKTTQKSQTEHTSEL